MDALSRVSCSLFETPATFSLSWLGKLLANDYHVELSMGVCRHGLVVEVEGAIAQWRPERRRIPLLPVALQLPGIREAWIAVPFPYLGEIRVTLDDDGASVFGGGEIAIDLPISSTPCPLLRFNGLIGIAR